MEAIDALPLQAIEQAVQMAALSHEFKTPLSVTLATLDLLQKKMRQHTDVYSQEYDALFGIAVRNIYKVLRMSNNFVDAGRLASGVAVVHFNNEDIACILRQTEECIMPMLQSRGARINFVCKAKTPVVIQCDGQALDRILLNLISNAFKHLPQQNGRILLMLDKLPAQQPDNEMVRISVTDNGSGICEKDFEHLYKRYWHDESEDSVDKTSTGLGLFITKALVELHGGTIEVQSEPHMATTFTVTLPVKQAEKDDQDVLRSNAVLYDSDSYALLLRQELSDL